MTMEGAVKGLLEVADWHYGKYEQTHEEDYLNDGDFLTAVANMLKAQEHEALNMPKPDSDIGCWYDITHNYTLEQVVNALKAQEPRLVTEADFDGADEYGYLPVWVEDKDDSEIICDCITKTAITDPDEDYHYRYWTSRPTDEQREAVKWE